MENTNREKIAALQEQRREINRQIRSLRLEGELTVGPARISRKQPPSELWVISYEVPLERYNSHYGQYRTIARAYTRREAIETIPEIIRNLQNLYDAAMAEDRQ